MDLRSAVVCILVLLTVIACFPAVSAETMPKEGTPEMGVYLEKIAHTDILQGTNKVGWDDNLWLYYGNKMKSQGSVNEAKEAYYKGYNYMNSGVGLRTNDKENELVSNIAAIEVSQGNTKTAKAIYDKTCPDIGCGNWKLMASKATFLETTGESKRAADLRTKAKQMMEAEAAKGHSGMGFDLPLDPMVVILGILGAVFISARTTIPKK